MSFCSNAAIHEARGGQECVDLQSANGTAVTGGKSLV